MVAASADRMRWWIWGGVILAGVGGAYFLLGTLWGGVVTGRIEVMRIPTNAMRPTLRGAGDGSQGDRVAVDLTAYVRQGPARWDIAVFDYPLDRSRRFIKRVVGLPGEHLRIHDGDIWVRPAGATEHRIPIRSRATRLTQSHDVYPPRTGASSTAPDSYWVLEPAGVWKSPRLGVLTFEGGGESALRARHPVLRSTRAETWSLVETGEPVRDLRVRFVLSLSADAVVASGTRLSVEWRPDATTTATLSIRPDGGDAQIERTGAEAASRPFQAQLQPGTRLRCELEYVDGRLHAWIDGLEVAVVEEGRSLDAERVGAQSLSITARGPSMTLTDLVIERDLAYFNTWDANPEAEQEGVEIPADCYFVLGDNSANSSDSRRWRRVRVQLRDGNVIEHDHGAYPDSEMQGGVTRKRVRDVRGKLWTWSEADEEGVDTDPAPFVPRALFLGRAIRVLSPGPEREVH